MKRKLFCIGMCIALIITLIPSMAFAEEISAASAVQSGNGAEHIGHADMEIGAAATPDAQAANTSNAIAGTIAVTQENEEEELVYEISSEQEEVMRLPYSTDWWFSFGTGDNGTFNAAENISETEIIIEKAGNELGREKLSIEKGFEKSDSIPGIDYGIWYYEGDNDIAEIYCNFHFDLGLDAYKYLTTLAGTYDITVNWLAGGQNYTASTQYILKPGQAISEISSIEYNDAGVIRSIWSNDSNFGTSMTYTYNPLVSYANPTTDGEAEGEREIVQRYIFTDCAYNGFFNFDRCVTEGLGNVFTKGDTIKYDADTELAPLYIHPRFITEDMVGKSATLIFKNGEIEKTITITIEKEANPSLTEGKLYAVRSWNVHPASETSDIIRIFCGDGGYTLSDLLETEIQLPMDESSNITFVTYQKQTLHQVNVAELSETDAAFLNMTYSETNGVKNYRLTPLQCGDVNIKALTEDAGTIQCHISLPEIGFYYTPARTGENFIRDEFHYKKATEKKADGTEAYVYLITPTYGYTAEQIAEQIKVSCGGWNAKTDAWEEKSIDGIAIGTPTVQNLDGEAYAIYKIAISQSYRNPGQNEVSFGIVYNNGENISTKELHIYDSTEILKEEQLHWFYDSSEIEISTDGKISLSSESEGSLDDSADAQIYWNNESGSIEGYFAVKKNGEYYALRTVQTSDPEGISLTESADTKYLYKLEWSKFGEYHITATENKMEYRLNFNVKLPEIGFYSNATRSEGTYIDNEFHYIDAMEKNVDNTEAYFYLIGPAYDYSLNQISVSFGEWMSEEETKDNVWTEKKVSGIEIGTPQMATFDNEKYAVWKITISDAYQNPYANWQDLRIAYGKEGMSRTKSIIIYDSTEIPEEEQLYWFYGSSEIRIDENGKMSLSSDSESSLDNRAAAQINWNNKSGSMEAYFAVKKDGEYYALRTVQTSETEGISLNEYAGTLYLYKLEWSKFGAYHITATDNGTEYRLNFNVGLPNIGFYSTRDRREENYLDEFYYAEAVEKSDDGKEAYFYCIAPMNGLSSSQMRAYFVEYVVDEETKTGNWVEKNIQGISIEQTVPSIPDEGVYAVWKIKIADSYKDDEIYQTICIDRGRNKGYYDFRIYGSKAISPSQQLYFFNSGAVTANEDGRLEARETEKNLNDLAFGRLSGGNSLTYGYFAVKQGDAYYAVTTLSAPDNVTITKIKDKLYNYYIKIGEYEVTATYQGKQYRMKAVHRLPDIGFFATAERTAENYLYDEFWVKEAVEENKDKAETYFYLYWKCYSEEQVDDTVRIESSARANDDRGGVKIEQLEQTVEEEKNCLIYKITVPSAYVANAANSGKKNCEEWRITIGKNMFTTVRIYDTEAIRSEAQLYWIYENSAQRKNGRLEPLEGHDSVYGRTEIERLTYDAYSLSKGYFALLKDGEYYPVNNISTTEEISASFDESTGIFTLTALHVGAYTIGYSDGKNNYYFKDRVEFPRAGCFVSTTRTEDTYIKSEEMFDYNTANENKSFYLIASENFIRVNNSSDPSRVHMKLKELEGRDISGIELGNSGTFEENGETYYYWEINVTKSFQHSSDYVQCVVELKDGDRSLYGRFLKIRGYVKYGDIDKNDKTDFADALWLKRYLADWAHYRTIARREADLDRDGKITASDLMILERHIASWKGYEKLPKVS